MRNIIVILGPTASGKSTLGVQLSKKFHGVVISADSRQVYRGMDIGTAKITKTEMRGVPHYLLDVASPKTQYSVARYSKDVQRVIKKLPESTPIFLVGGTPFYIKAVTEPGSFSSVPPNPALRRRLATKSANQLLNQLTRLNPQRAQTIDPANRQRLIRAIEVVSSKSSTQITALPPMQLLKIGIQVPRQTLYQRIDRRAEIRIKNIITEVNKLHRNGLSWKRLESFGLEYRFGSLAAQGKITLAEAVTRIQFGSHDFARRQLTWWRKEKDIRWVLKPSKAAALVTKFLSKPSLRTRRLG